MRRVLTRFDARITLWAGIVLAVFGGAAPLHACVCLEQGTVEDQFRSADAVFVGRIIAIEIQKVTFEGGESENMVATFEVTQRWKGPRRSRIRVTTCGTQAVWCNCTANFDLGGSYLVVAHGKPFGTGLCDLTQQVDAAADVIKQIELHAKQWR